jgi:hypothetical protein
MRRCACFSLHAEVNTFPKEKDLVVVEYHPRPSQRQPHLVSHLSIVSLINASVLVPYTVSAPPSCFLRLHMHTHNLRHADTGTQTHMDTRRMHAHTHTHRQGNRCRAECHLHPKSSSDRAVLVTRLTLYEQVNYLDEVRAVANSTKFTMSELQQLQLRSMSAFGKGLRQPTVFKFTSEWRHVSVVCVAVFRSHTLTHTHTHAHLPLHNRRSVPSSMNVAARSSLHWLLSESPRRCWRAAVAGIMCRT